MVAVNSKYPVKNYKLNTPDVETTTTIPIPREGIDYATTPSHTATSYFLIDKQPKPTIEEVKKEWEEAGWEFDDKTHKGLIAISKLNPIYHIIDHIYIKIKKRTYDFDCDIDIKTHQLLTKLFIAKGWIK